MSSSKNNRLKTEFVRLDTRKCTGCFKCMEKCMNGVIGKVSFLWHKHVYIDTDNATDCIGCMKCVKVCPKNAFSIIPESK